MICFRNAPETSPYSQRSPAIRCQKLVSKIDTPTSLYKITNSKYTINLAINGSRTKGTEPRRCTRDWYSLIYPDNKDKRDITRYHGFLVTYGDLTWYPAIRAYEKYARRCTLRNPATTCESAKTNPGRNQSPGRECTRAAEQRRAYRDDGVVTSLTSRIDMTSDQGLSTRLQAPGAQNQITTQTKLNRSPTRHRQKWRCCL